MSQPFDKGSMDEVSNLVPGPLVITHIIDSAYEGGGVQLFRVAEGKLL